MDATSAFWTRVQAVEEHLDRLDYTALSDADKVTAMTRIRRLADRMAAGAAVVTDAADKANATEHTTGTPLGDFLAAAEGRTPSQGIGVVKRASKLAHHSDVRDAALAGDVSPDHATVIGEEIRKFPRGQMSDEQVDRAAGLFLDRAATTPPGQLKRATQKILEEVAPEAAPSPGDEAPGLPPSEAVPSKTGGWCGVPTVTVPPGSPGNCPTWRPNR
ncbi:MAG: hypothetical protein LKI24_12655 [Acidipropionibacterium sp.]|jgi:hypothetical protein|nr:hypothetical protein [Acidipropionibacterium sp.]